MACLQIYLELLSLMTYLWVHSNSKEVSYLLQNMYPNFKTTCHIKLQFFLWTKLLENLILAKYLITVTVPLIKLKNNYFESICDWFVDYKLNTNFGNYRTKSTLFTTKFKIKKVRRLNIKYGDIKIKQHSKIKYLGCMEDEAMSVETMAFCIINKINNKLKFLYQKNRILSLNPEMIAV